jgi:flagellar motility protein MotE (MotC chaperone)
MYHLSSSLNRFQNFFRLSIVLRAMIVCCVIVFASKLLTLTNLYSAAPNALPASSGSKKDIPQQPPVIHNVQLDDQGLTLKLDFMNLTATDVQVLESLFNYREKLKEKANEVIKKEDQLKIVESRIQQQLIELKRIKSEIANLLDQHDEQEEKKLLLLVRIYENMKPDQAAQIFNSLSEERVLMLLQRMKEVKSSAILANMNPSQASYLTDLIIGQKELKK